MIYSSGGSIVGRRVTDFRERFAQIYKHFMIQQMCSLKINHNLRGMMFLCKHFCCCKVVVYRQNFNCETLETYIGLNTMYCQ